MTQKGISCGLVAVALMVLGASCSGSSKASTLPPPSPVTSTTPTTPPVDYGAKYLALVGPYNSAIDTFNKSLTANMTSAELGAAADKLAVAGTQLDEQLIAVAWPGQVETDVRSLVSDDAAVIGDLQGFDSVNVLSASQLISQFDKDANVADTAAALVRSDLHLTSNLSS